MPMEINGTIVHNLRNAIKSAERLRGQPVYPDTLQFWRDLIRMARAKRVHDDDAGWMLSQTVSKLEALVADFTGPQRDKAIVDQARTGPS